MSGEQLSEIVKAVKTFVQESFLSEQDDSALGADEPLLTSGVIDSVSMVMLINHLEESFDISFEAHEIDREAFNTVAQIAEQVFRKKRASS